MSGPRNWELILGKTESPIERKFLLAFCDAAAQSGYRLWKRPSASDVIAVRPQQIIGRFRADFVIAFLFFGNQLDIVVECDGHKWHEKTPWQAARDRARDRFVTAQGYRIMRFTGSEINADAARCALQVLDMIMDFQTAAILRAPRTKVRS